jgi:hypothetical protein
MSDTETARNAAQIAYWNSEAGPRWVAMQERMDMMLAPLMNAALDRAALVQTDGRCSFAAHW